MKKLIFLLPVILAVEFAAVSGIFYMLSYPNNVSFYAGVCCISVFAVVNYFLLKQILK